MVQTYILFSLKTAMIHVSLIPNEIVHLLLSSNRGFLTPEYSCTTMVNETGSLSYNGGHARGEEKMRR